MCLAIPMRVVSVEHFTALCEARGVSLEVSLFLLPKGSVAAGDHVMVHVGYAIQALSQNDEAYSWELFDTPIAPQENPRASSHF